MSDYYTNIPRRSVAGCEVPALFLGDNGFNTKFGSVLDDSDVRDRMVLALSLGNIGLTAGDDRLARLVREAEEAAAQSAVMMYHTDLPLADSSGALRYRSCGATLRCALEDRAIDFPSDPVLSYLSRFDVNDRLTPRSFSGIGIDDEALSALSETVQSYRPSIVTVGGDWLDMLLLAHQTDLVMTGLQAMEEIISSADASMALTLYVGAIVNFAIPASARALLVPVNTTGVAMLPERQSAIGWAAASGRDLIAMHVLGGGATDTPTDALRHIGVASGDLAAAVIGASSVRHIRALLLAARSVWHRDA